MGNWFSLPLMRDRYCFLLDQIEMGNVIGFSTKNLEAECWQIRKESYKILAKLRDEGQLVKSAAAVFGWSLEQLDSEVLREWLCEGGDTGRVGKSEQTPVVSTEHHPLGEQGLWRTPSKKVPEKQQLPAYLTSRTPLAP